MSESQTTGLSHAKIETNNFLMIVLILLVLLVGGIVEIVPLYFQRTMVQPIEGVQPLTPLQVAGRDVYLREGCYGCHSQMIRPFRAETLRYGHYSVAGESVYDHPFQWGSKRTGPDLARVGGRYSDEWHRVHMNNPRELVPESNMPAYPWLNTNQVDGATIAKNMAALKAVGVPYTDADIAGAGAAVKDKTEMDAVVAYLQSLGLALSPKAPAAVTSAAAAAAEPVAAPVAISETDPSVVVENGVVKFYFAKAQDAVASNAAPALTDVVAAVKAGKKLKISGFHDSSGDPARNVELAKRRAQNVAAALTAQGVDASAMEMVKPANAEGTGDPAQARRVEVSIVE